MSDTTPENIALIKERLDDMRGTRWVVQPVNAGRFLLFDRQDWMMHDNARAAFIPLCERARAALGDSDAKEDA